MEKLSICVIAYNEEKFLPNLLKNIKEQKYPHNFMEIVLVDSASNDKTKKIMELFQQEDNGFYSVQVLDNPKKIQAAGWNVAITHATGDVISRIDAHSMLPPEFSEKVMQNINQGEDIVGGVRPCIIENDTKWCRNLLNIENSMFGSSINSSKRKIQKSYVKTMFHASYRREIFEHAGLFNEMLLRTEDNEIHYRMRKLGYKLCYDPEIISYQYARKSLKKMLVQKYKNGLWIGLTLGVCPGCISYYHLIPYVFVVGILLTSLLWIFGYYLFAAVLWGMYGIFVIIGTMTSIRKDGFCIWSLLMPIVFLMLHVSYGIGTLIGIGGIPKIKRSAKNKMEVFQ